MLDSSGALFPAGLLSGTYTSFGDYDTCLAVEGDFVGGGGGGGDDNAEDHHHHQVRGQHCFATMRLPADVPRAIDYSFAGLVPHSNESWPAALAKRWSEVDVRFPVAHALCLPDVCRADFIADVVKNGKFGGFPYVISFVIIFCCCFCSLRATAEARLWRWILSDKGKRSAAALSLASGAHFRLVRSNLYLVLLKLFTLILAPFLASYHCSSAPAPLWTSSGHPQTKTSKQHQQQSSPLPLQMKTTQQQRPPFPPASSAASPSSATAVISSVWSSSSSKGRAANKSSSGWTASVAC